jgi:hypothetical protein
MNKMLKKAGNIVIIVLLLVATAGIPVTRHYCGHVQKSVSLYSTPKACCGGSCDKCHNVFKFTKVNDDFESGSSATSQALTDYVTLHTSFFIDLFDNVNSSIPNGLLNQRAIFTQKAGHSPASPGNSRC